MAREVSRVHAILLLALLAIPSAAALEARGSFTVQGRMQVPSPVLEGAPLALALDDGGGLGIDRLVLRASVLNVTIHRSQGVGLIEEAVGPQRGFYVTSGRSNESFVLHNATIRLASVETYGIVGLDADGRARARMETDGLVEAAPALRSTLAAGDRTTDSDAEDDVRYYHAELDRPHLFARGAGDMTFAGPGKVKLFGMTLDVSADESTPRLHLTRSQPSPGVVQDTWAVLRADDLEIEVRSPRSWQAAFLDLRLEWDGEARFRAVEGRVSTPGPTYAAPPGPVSITGAFQGDLLPEARQGNPRGRLDLEGDLARSTLAASGPATAPARAEASLLPWIAVGLVAAAGSAGGALLLLRRRPKDGPDAAAAPVAATAPGASPEALVERAHAFLERGDMRQALHWITRARRVAPTSASVCLTQAFLLGELGEIDQALQAYREAARLAPADAEASLCAARLAHQSGRRPEEVEDLLEQTLARDPSHVQEIEADAFFAGFAGRPRFEHMVETAWKRHVSNLSDPE